MKSLSMNPDPDIKWIYDSSHRDYNSDHAKDLRNRRARAIANAPEYMKREAALNDLLKRQAKMSRENGGPAFPTENEMQTGHNSYHYEGMSLRDYFAAKYLEGYMANPNIAFSTREEVAEQSYLMADAMLKARQAK